MWAFSLWCRWWQRTRESILLAFKVMKSISFVNIWCSVYLLSMSVYMNAEELMAKQILTFHSDPGYYSFFCWAGDSEITVIIIISLSNFANINKMKIRDKFVTEVFVLPISELCKLLSYVNNFPFHTLS